jgi:uncharacterized protein
VKRRVFIRRTLFATAGIGATGVGISVYTREIEPAWIEINIIPLRLTRLDATFQGYRIVHITDLHTDDTWMTADRLAEVVRLVNEQKPDLIVITGDFITSMLRSSATTLAALKHLQAHDGVLAVLGNHDAWHEPEMVRTILKANGIHELKDAIQSIQRQDTALHIIGLDDLWPSPKIVLPIWSHAQRLKQLTDRLPEKGAAILLVHEPDFADVAAANGRIDLQLSGHSHGGQIRVPFYGAIELPPLSTRYPDGMYQIQHLQHYTNRGLGMVKPQVRFNCRPEIAVFVCQPA